MDPRLVPGFQRNFHQHSTVVMLRAAMQRKTLLEMLLAAQRAEDDYTNVQRTAREAVGLGGQSFVSGSDTRGVSVFPSQAVLKIARSNVGSLLYSVDEELAKKDLLRR